MWGESSSKANYLKNRVDQNNRCDENAGKFHRSIVSSEISSSKFVCITFAQCCVHNVARKVSKAVGIIYKSSFCLNSSSLRILYFSLIYPYLFYCVSVWASTFPSNLRRLITLQKRVIGIMSECF